MKTWLWVVGLWAGVALQAMAAQQHVRGELKFETGPVPAFVEPIEPAASWDPKAPGASDGRWRYWLYEQQADRRTGRDVYFMQHVFEARAAALVGDAGRFQIDFNPEFQRLTIHKVEVRRDGRWENRLVPERISLAQREDEFEEDLTNGRVTALIVMDDVRVGDVVRVAYSVAGSNPILGGQGSEWHTFGWVHPVLLSRMRVLYDPGTPVRIHREHFTGEPRIRRGGDAVEVVLEGRNIAPVVDEGDYPAWYQPYPTAQVAPDLGWKDVVQWALPLYPAFEGRFDDDLERRIEEWKRLPDQASKLTAALRAVQDDVRYFGIEIGDNTHKPNPPDMVWRRRYGDCKDKTLLLVSILRRLDIDASPALIATDRGRAISGFVPSAAVFDHVIVRARLGNEVLWVDPTMAQQGGDPRKGDLSSFGYGLVIAPGIAALEEVKRPRQTDDGVVVAERFLPSADGKEVRFSVETTYTGAWADYQRRRLKDESRDELGRRFSEYYGKRYGEVELVDAPLVEDDPARNVLRVREQYRLKSALQSEGGGIRALDVYAEAVGLASALPDTTSRKSPLSFSLPGRYRHEVTVELPDRWRATFDPVKGQHDGDAFGFTRDVQVRERDVRLVYQFDVTQRDLPADKVGAHIEQLRKVRDELDATLRFRIPAATDAAQREERLRNLLRDVGGDAP